MVSALKYGCSPATHSPHPSEAFRLYLDQQDAPIGRRAKTRLERSNQRHVDLAQDDGVDSHKSYLIGLGQHQLERASQEVTG